VQLGCACPLIAVAKISIVSVVWAVRPLPWRRAIAALHFAQRVTGPMTILTSARLIIALVIFASSSAVVADGVDTSQPVGGAVPEVTEAEKLRRSEESYQAKLARIGEAIAVLEKRASALRKQVVAPDWAEIDTFAQDITLIANELAATVPPASSPLAQLQRSELQDRVAQLEFVASNMKRRWGGAPAVFGLDFFKNATQIPGTDTGPVPENYRLRVGDRIRVVLTSNLGARDEFDVTVDARGGFVLPGAGRVVAVGKTTGWLETAILKKIAPRFKQLRVEVTVSKLSTLRVQVAGAVVRPGTLSLTGMATVLTALYSAGGPTESGTLRRISLVRGNGRKIQIDLYDFLLHGSKKQDLLLDDGDLIFVPPVGPTVTVLGEVIRPGRYEPTFPIKLADMLKMAGGVKSGSYLQNVQVERVENNEYKVLFSEPVAPGDSKGAFLLRPGDEITVLSVRPDRTNQVSISGAVKSPGVYGFREGMRVSDLIKMAQGLLEDREVYGGRADVLRVEPTKGTRVIAFNLDKALAKDLAEDIELRKLDRVFVYEPDQVVFRPRLVTISGAVARPGTYKRSEDMRVSDLVAAAGGVLPDAYLPRADLIRYDQNNRTRIVRVGLQDALSGDPSANTRLQNRDELTVYKHSEVEWRDNTVRIEGAVQRPGVYERAEDMRVSDLLFASGGLVPEAAREAELARCDESGRSSVKRIDLSKLVAGSENDLLLNDRDVLTIQSRNPYNRAPQVVFLTGEVARPGPYALESDSETLVDLIRRAGGLTQKGDVNAMLFLRQRDTVRSSQQNQEAETILEKSKMFADKQFLVQLAKMGVTSPVKTQQEPATSQKPLEATLTLEKTAAREIENGGMATEHVNGLGKEPAELPKTESKTSAFGPPLSTPTELSKLSAFLGRHKLGEVASATRVSVSLARALADPKCADNVPMCDGDRVFIAKKSDVVTVVGAVLHPHAFAARPGQSADYYIRRSGGYAQDAAPKYAVVIKGNGDALPASSVKSVEPGDMVVVPTSGLIDVARKWEKVGSVSKIVSEVLSSVFVLTRF